MNETELALQRLSDTSAFETLAVVYMEWRWPELRGLIQTGINSEAKPIACPIDGIRILPITDGSQKLALFAATTTADVELPRKWLGETPTTRTGKKRKKEPKKGDIDKAAEHLGRWKQDHPHARATLYLATNRRPDTDLLSKATASAKALGLDAVEFIEASALLRFLEFDPDGQYAREVVLKLPAARLNAGLLTDICRESLEGHAARFPLAHSGNWAIERDAAPDLITLVGGPGPVRIALQGPSGCGKSVFLRQTGEQILKDGGFAVWVSAEALETAHTVEGLIQQILLQYRSHLGGRAATEALELAATVPGGLVLLVDDVNRLPRSERALESVGALAEGSSRCCWVVPVWPGQVRDDCSSAAPSSDQPAWYTLDLGRYSPGERGRLAARVPAALCDAVDGDPFLCALMPSDAQFDWGPTRSDVLRQIIDLLIDRATRDAAAQQRLPAPAADYAASLDALVACVLRLDDPEPPWSRLRAELGASADQVVVLAERSRLGRIEPGPNGHWRWTHDRLRDLLVGRWLSQTILAADREPTAEEAPLLRHPGLAEAWAVAAACLPPGEARQQALRRLGENQPLALAKALQLTLFPDEIAERDIMRQALSQALVVDEPRAKTTVGTAASAVVWTLTQTDERLVLQIVPKESDRVWELTARFRNGDINAGLQFIHLMSHDFLPGIRFRHFESAVAAFGRVFDDRRDRLIQALRNAVGDDADMARSVLILAGYLGWPQWEPLARELWQRLPAPEKDQSIAEAIWSLARMSGSDAPPELEEAVVRACEVVEAEKRARDAAPGPTLTEGSHPHEELRFAWPRWPIAQSASQLFAHLLREQPARAQVLSRIVAGIDTPETVEAVFRASPGALASGEPMDPLSDRGTKDDPFPRHPETRNRLWELSRTEPKLWDRKRAFRVWREAMSAADLPRLQEVPVNDPLFDDVLAARLRLRDAAAAPLLIERMETAPDRWCAFAPAVYGEPGVEEAFERNLDTAFTGGSWWAPEGVALHLSPEQVSRLLDRRGDVFLQRPRSWPALWQSDVPKALQFVRRAIEQASKDSVQHFFMAGGWPYPLSLRMLNSLRPVLDKFSEHDLAFGLGLLALRVGHVSWVKDHIAPRLPPDANPPWLDHARALAMLDQAAGAVPQGEMAVMRSGVMQLAHARGDWLFESTTTVLRDWLGAVPRPEQAVVAALILERVGSGSDWDWWQALTRPPGLEGLFERVGWHLRRRRWQPMVQADG